MVHFAKWKILLTLAILLAGIVLAAPNLLTEQQATTLPSWLPAGRINLGLDLQGGSHLLYSVDVQGAVREDLESTREATRDELRKAKIKYTGLEVVENSVLAKLGDLADRDKARELLATIAGDKKLTIDDAGNVKLELDEVTLNARIGHIIEQSIEVIRRRIDETGVREPTIVRQGQDRILVQLPGVKDPERVKELIGKTAKMTFQFVDETVSAEDILNGLVPLPAGRLVLPYADTDRTNLPSHLAVEKRIMVSGENLVDAQPSTNEFGQWVVNFRFDSIGAKKFGKATEDGVGRLFAIVLDGTIISAPVIRQPILGGSGVIEGGFTAQSAQDLALLLRAGALPTQLIVEEERTVGAELGADSIAAGKTASLMGIILICVALIAMYGLFGLFANVALLFNFILLIGALSVLQATLTLPGIAGIVLALGLAVDANVLIHERIREEIRVGRGPVSAIDAGYRSAAGTITDANLTVIISSAFLYLFGSGTVKGFAVTLILGTIISMFTAVVVARLCTVWWLRWARPSSLPI
ncbi:MAG: protein translocase subunit SecD [Dongiaceae bacterium]